MSLQHLQPNMAKGGLHYLKAACSFDNACKLYASSLQLYNTHPAAALRCSHQGCVTRTYWLQGLPRQPHHPYPCPPLLPQQRLRVAPLAPSCQQLSHPAQQSSQRGQEGYIYQLINKKEPANKPSSWESAVAAECCLKWSIPPVSHTYACCTAP